MTLAANHITVGLHWSRMNLLKLPPFQSLPLVPLKCERNSGFCCKYVTRHLEHTLELRVNQNSSVEFNFLALCCFIHIVLTCLLNHLLDGPKAVLHWMPSFWTFLRFYPIRFHLNSNISGTSYSQWMNSGHEDIETDAVLYNDVARSVIRKHRQGTKLDGSKQVLHHTVYRGT